MKVAPTIKHLFKGFDTTIFAYGVTGSGKTYSMRGGKSLAERGVIPRLLSGIYRKGRKIEKDSAGATIVEVTMSYYEIYNVRVPMLWCLKDSHSMVFRTASLISLNPPRSEHRRVYPYESSTGRPSSLD